MREWRKKIREERGKLAEDRKGEMDQPLKEGFWQDHGGSVVFIGTHRTNCTSLDVGQY